MARNDSPEPHGEYAAFRRAAPPAAGEAGPESLPRPRAATPLTAPPAMTGHRPQQPERPFGQIPTAATELPATDPEQPEEPEDPEDPEHARKRMRFAANPFLVGLWCGSALLLAAGAAILVWTYVVGVGSAGSGENLVTPALALLFYYGPFLLTMGVSGCAFATAVHALRWDRGRTAAAASGSAGREPAGP